MFKKLLYLTPCVVALLLALPSPGSAKLVGWWAFDETSGTVAGDASGNGNNGTLINGPLWVSGYFDGALKLDGTDDYVALPINSLVPTLKECTLSIWVNWAGGNAWQRIIDIGGGTADYIYLTPFNGTTTALHVAIVANNGIWDEFSSSKGQLGQNAWHNIALTVSDSAKTMIMYLDGQEVGSMTNMTNSVDDLGQTTNNWLGRSQYADPYFNGIIDDFRIYDEVLSPEGVQKVMENVVTVATRPSPKDRTDDVRPDTVLSWKPGQYAASHDVYFGTSLDDVSAASRTDSRNVLVAQGQDANTYDPPGLLTLGQVYYWRVDEVNAPSSPGTVKGTVWRFTAEPVAYAVTPVTVTASSAGATTPAINTINGSGLTGDLHSTDTKAMWLTTSSGPKPAWIQYEFDRVYKLHELWVWNQNSAYESLLGFGARSTTITYSMDGTTWATLGDFEFKRAAGADNYAHDTTIPFDVAAKQVRITINSSWGGSTVGLSEVRFYYTPVMAREPNPASGSTGVNPSVILSWRPGREAVSHNVYVGTDANAVKASATPTATTTTPDYTPSDVQLSMTYYWRVDEVNPAQATSTWVGDVWSFSTPDFLVVDDFEGWNDREGTRIFDGWVDGYATTTNGAQVGYNAAPFADQSIVHGGRQSMPFAYTNTGSITNSEATRTFEATQDWTTAGIKTLVLFFRGLTTNSAGQLFVKINNTKVDYPGGTAGIAQPLWKQWNIDLTSITAAKAVKELTIGVSGSGSGMLYIDDIRLYKVAPAIATPVDPGTTNLVAYFPMEGDAKDASGHGYVGTVSNATFVNSMTGFGKAAQFNGTTAFIDLGASFGTGVIKGLTSCTIAAWVDYTGVGAMWQRVFDIGNQGAGGADPTVYMFMTTHSNANNAPRFAITTGGNTAEATASGARALSVGWHHLAAVIDASGATPTIGLYVDGDLSQGTGVPNTPSGLGATTNNWLGRSLFSADPYFNGAIDDFRVYNRALSVGEVRYLVGAR
jgi:hypothetical protein